MQLLSEIKEKDASGKTLLLYNDIKYITGFPLVNLIYRSMATVDGCLEWSWFTLRPLYLDNTFNNSINNFFDKNKTNINYFLDFSSLSPDEQKLLSNTLDVYRNLNPINLIALYSLKILLEKKDTNKSSLPNIRLNNISSYKKILPIVDLDNTNKSSLESLISLSKILNNEEPLVIPSLFRHISPWPNLLEDAIPLIKDLLIDDKFSEDVKSLNDYCLNEANKFTEKLLLFENVGSLENIKNKINNLITQFPYNMCKMTLISNILKKNLII